MAETNSHTTSTLRGTAHALTPDAAAPPVFAGRAWQQVLARDASADGQFVYAVKSTGVYCRPSCPSRRPERKNVSFYPAPELAEAAGFRACLRCDPRTCTPREDPQAAAVATAAKFLTAHAGERTSLDELAAVSGLGRFALQRAFKRVLGLTPGEFARQQRRERFRDKVRTPNRSITEAVYEAGFGSSSRLYEGAAQNLGMSPTAMRSGGAGETIYYSVAMSALGPLLVATTAVGLCAVLFAETGNDAELELRARFPQAALRRASEQTDPPHLPDAVQFVLSHLTEHPAAASFPLHVRATAFQQRVWKALLEIPRGETRTYSQIARQLAGSGTPAVRAVGTACASNLLALVIPCHRVTGAGGRLAGYRWGIDRKRQLLDLEQAKTAADGDRTRPAAI